jgi:hypothetical protein
LNQVHVLQNTGEEYYLPFLGLFVYQEAHTRKEQQEILFYAILT